MPFWETGKSFYYDCHLISLLPQYLNVSFLVLIKISMFVVAYLKVGGLGDGRGVGLGGAGEP